MTEHQPALPSDAVRAPQVSATGASQAGAFDQLVERYGAAFADRAEQVRAGAWLVERLRPGARVLDVGCGTGIPTARQLAAAGMRVVGIDISPAMVSAASVTAPEAVIRNCDILDLAETGSEGAAAFTRGGPDRGRGRGYGACLVGCCHRTTRRSRNH